MRCRFLLTLAGESFAFSFRVESSIIAGFLANEANHWRTGGAMSDLVFILNGPNLNLLGTREPDIYGHDTLADIEENCGNRAESLGLSIDFRQSNNEGELIDWIQAAAGKAMGVIINPGAYSHTSVAIHDALLGVGIPTIEVHLSNIFAREPFRRHSYISSVAAGVISGLGGHGYILALDAVSQLVRSQSRVE